MPFRIIQIPAGQSSVTVTGLGLPTPPNPPSLTLLAPVNPPDAIFPFLIGPTTTDGFTIGLDAPPSVNGYSVKWEYQSDDSTSPPGVTGGSATAPVPLLPFPWKDRSALISGKQSINGNSFYLCIDPYAASFFIYPEVDDNHQIVVNWDGVRNTFSPSDTVPFDEECAGVVATYVDAWLSKGAHDWSTWGEAMKPGVGSYYRKMRNLLLNAQNRAQMRMA